MTVGGGEDGRRKRFVIRLLSSVFRYVVLVLSGRHKRQHIDSVNIGKWVNYSMTMLSSNFMVDNTCSTISNYCLSVVI